MADRYWVGGTASWDGTAGSKWALTSGGAGGQAVPTASDDVYFDASSGAVNVTVSGSRVCNNITFTGFTGTFAGSGALAVSGSFTLASGMTNSYTGDITFNATSSGKTITLAGKSLGSEVTFSGNGGGWVFQDAFSTTGSITFFRTSLDFNNQNVTANSLVSSTSFTRTLTLGSGTLTLTGSSLIKLNFATSTGLTFNAGTSTIKLADAITNDKTFNGGGQTFYNFWNATTGDFAVTIVGSNIFNDFTINPGRTQKFTAGTTQIINGSFSSAGTVGSPIVISSTGSSFTLSKSSGTVEPTYTTISNSTATGGAFWRAFLYNNNTDGGGNSGWTFAFVYNSSKPSASITNTAKVSFAELWSTIDTTWATETRTWAEMASFFDNVSRPTTSITNTSRP